MMPTEPATGTDLLIIATLIALLVATPFALYAYHTWVGTREKLQTILDTVKHPPTHAAREYPTCRVCRTNPAPSTDEPCPACAKDFSEQLNTWGH
jgi:hypothetical protein